jgi:hypothetical protein
MKEHYTVENYPVFVCNHGNWDIYANSRGWCAAIPTPQARANGCIATHFGDAQYVKSTLGVTVTLPVEPAPY